MLPVSYEEVAVGGKVVSEKFEVTALEALADLVLAIREHYQYKLPIGVALVMEVAEDFIRRDRRKVEAWLADEDWDDEPTQPDLRTKIEEKILPFRGNRRKGLYW